ncbi:hypothetical protein GCM10027193_16580 [Arenimonas aestuarii]
MIRDLHTVEQFAAKTPFSAGQLRWWIHNAETNGLASHSAIVRVGGRRVYIDPEGFDAWISSQNTRQGNAA